MEPGAGPERKRYFITEEGKHEVEAWLAEPIPAEPYLQTDLFVKVALSLMLGRRGRSTSTCNALRISAGCASSLS